MMIRKKYKANFIALVILAFVTLSLMTPNVNSQTRRRSRSNPTRRTSAKPQLPPPPVEPPAPTPDTINPESAMNLLLKAPCFNEYVYEHLELYRVNGLRDPVGYGDVIQPLIKKGYVVYREGTLQLTPEGEKLVFKDAPPWIEVYEPKDRGYYQAGLTFKLGTRELLKVNSIVSGGTNEKGQYFRASTTWQFKPTEIGVDLLPTGVYNADFTLLYNWDNEWSIQSPGVCTPHYHNLRVYHPKP